jgi:hypothetical protein
MFLLSYLLSPATAAELVSVDRPSVGTSTYTIDKGGIQVEYGLQVDAPEYNFSTPQYSTPLMLRIGVTNGVEIRPYASTFTTSKMNVLNANETTTASENLTQEVLTSPGVQAKIKLYAPESTNMAISVLGDVGTSSGGSILLVDFWKDNWSYWTNMGTLFTYPQKDASLGTDFLVLAGVGYALPNAQGLFIESSSIISNSTTLTIESGYTKMLGTIQVDLYALKDLTQDDAWQVAMGFAYRFR